MVDDSSILWAERSYGRGGANHRVVISSYDYTNWESVVSGVTSPASITGSLLQTLYRYWGGMKFCAYMFASVVAPRLYHFYEAVRYYRANCDQFESSVPLFIHVPKCGGTSVRAMLGEDRYFGHQSSRNLRFLMHSKFDQAYKFAVVRDPVERFLSAVSYLSTNAISSRDAWINKRLIKGREINAVVDSMASNPVYRKMVMASRSIWPQSYFLCDNKGHVLVNEVIPFRNIEHGVNSVLRQHGIKTPVPHLNASHRKPVELSEDRIDFIRQMYAADYKMLDALGITGVQLC